jgi:hypothetical protein
VRIAPGDPEYWIASSNPETDQPLRHLALRQAADPWEALALLCDPAFTDRHRQPHHQQRGRS